MKLFSATVAGPTQGQYAYVRVSTHGGSSGHADTIGGAIAHATPWGAATLDCMRVLLRRMTEAEFAKLEDMIRAQRAEDDPPPADDAHRAEEA